MWESGERAGSSEPGSGWMRIGWLEVVYDAVVAEGEWASELHHV